VIPYIGACWHKVDINSFEKLTLILLKISQVIQKLKWKITADDLLNLLFFHF